MRSVVADRRYELADLLLPRAAELTRLERARLRFAFGVSAADIRIPFHVTPEVVQLVWGAAQQLELLVLRRHGLGGRNPEFQRPALADELAMLPRAPDSLLPASSNPAIRAAAENGMRAHPALTGGVLGAWLGPGGRGRALVGMTLDLFRRSFLELREDGREETPFWVALMLSSVFPAAEAAIRAVEGPPGLVRSVKGATSTGLFLAFSTAAEMALKEGRATSELSAKVEAALNPVPLFGGRGALARGTAGFYGCDLSHAAALLEAAVTELLNGQSVSSVQLGLARRIEADEALAAVAESAIAESQLRGLILRAGLLAEEGALPPGPGPALREIATRMDGLSALLSEERRRKELGRELSEAASRATGAGPYTLLALASALAGYQEEAPLRSVGLTPRFAFAHYARAVTSAASDLWSDKLFGGLRRALDARTGAEGEGGLEAQYATGRLYLLSAREERILKEQKQAVCGHLFVDVKDFTRRTSLLGDEVMAEFLRREFYVPILAAAKTQVDGSRRSRGGVSLNNLLGDALSLSGDIELLVAVATDIRLLLAVYERRLAGELSSQWVQSALKDIEDDFARRAGVPGVDGTRLAVEKQEALARARGEGLEAGVFVAIGPAPVVVTIEDEVFGRSKVAIADGINQSARGTARSPGARARVDSLLDAERARGNPSLVHPWAVFVGAPLTVTVPVLAAEQARLAARAGAISQAMRALADPVRQAVEAAAKQEDAVGDIYNAGVAISEPALEAFRKATSGVRVFRGVELRPENLHPELRARFFFPSEPIRLLFAYTPEGAVKEIFRYAGRAMFKGLERTGGIGVWELCAETAAGELLARHHAPEWFPGK